MKALKRWKLSAAVALSAVFSGISALPAAAAMEAIRETELAQFSTLDSCRVINVASVEPFVGVTVGSSRFGGELTRGTQVNLLEANIPGADGELWHEIEIAVGGRGNREIVYIPATSGAFDTSTLAYCGGSTSTSSGSCRQIDSASQLYLYTSPELSSTTEVRMYQGEQIQVLAFNVAGGGEVWHEVIDSVGNRGYILASDPADGMSTVRNCSFQVTW